MGILGFIKDELVEIIDWLEGKGDVLVHRFSTGTKNIKYGAQLTVREGQVALFLDEGRLADVFPPGRYVLTTENMPVLSRLHGWMHGFKSPFLCDVVFVSTRQFPALTWGTPNAVIMRDPELKQVRVRAYGTYTLRVKDAPSLLRRFAGVGDDLLLSQIEDKLRNQILSRFSDALAELGVSVLDLARNYNELGGRLVPLLQPDFEAFGFELVQFFIGNASVPPEVEALFDKVTQMNAVGDIARFAAFEAAGSIRTLAEKSGAGGLPGVGAQVALGAALGQQMAGVLAPPSAPASPAVSGETREQILATLRELGSLRDAGVLTPEEFQAKKTELLRRL